MNYNYKDYKRVKALIEPSELIKANQGEEFFVNIARHHKSKAPVWFEDFVDHQFKPLVVEVKDIKQTLNEHAIILKQHGEAISNIQSDIVDIKVDLSGVKTKLDNIIRLNNLKY